MKLGLFGCGGIGVEFLHSIKYLNIEHITLVDFDMIEPSNLSRQFIFTQNDIGHSKSHACANFCKIHFKNATIYNFEFPLQQLPLQKFQNFDLVVSALDNVPARKFLQMRCLAFSLNLIDCGTSGLSGSIRVFKSRLPSAFPPKISCHNCSTLEQITIPVCTLRSKPETPNHCIQFALATGNGLLGNGEFSEIQGDRNGKLIFKQLFKSQFDENLATKTVNQVESWIQIVSNFTDCTDFFDANNKQQLQFVCAVSRLRALQFHIKFDLTDIEIQSVAGRIVPAVCFSNGLIGALAAQICQEKLENQYILTGKTSPYIRYDEVGAPDSGCQFCGVECFRVAAEEAEDFLLAKGDHFVVYEGEKCVYQHQSNETDDSNGWFSEEDNYAPKIVFKYEIGQLLTIVYKNGQKLNIIITSSQPAEMMWAAVKKCTEIVDLDDDDSISFD
ncbi:Ubiquitin-activating enzyme E1 [Spironucleus salmonicida]|uniref:NEDD8-activating enzyme E1 catalytic subunit n=1 Tax=Spironucleus salmonicida TaxID=348837 RepID=V6LY28_9EUKA|nr:Ubiquitin-activating enzyme E1 [Spironucleus salmonicida]|eukprot:EST48626.1 Ubiquitin-activating enzyme E1 [Spironucleus salmonicida]